MSARQQINITVDGHYDPAEVRCTGPINVYAHEYAGVLRASTFNRLALYD